MFFIPKYILILLFTIVIDYFAGILLEREHDKKKRKRWLILSLVANVGVLAVFKYYNFFNANLKELADTLGWNYGIPALEMILPIGLSFHTFQAMSYTIEVYRGNQKAERHFGIYALYVMYYPQLVAGPIERPQNLLWQFHKKHEFDYKRVTDGLKQMAFGLFKKVVIADRISTFINPVFDSPEGYHQISIFIACLLFSVQIFCDFSGYSDIAIGASRVMGIDLMRNFDRPYFAKTISEFWKRWHISLSTWFKDYLYIPLGGSKKGKFRTYRNLVIVFLISGLWHGANWTFILWGAIHALFNVFGLLTEKFREKLRNVLLISRNKKVEHLVQSSILFLIVSYAWIYFRADTIEKAWYISTKFLTAIPVYVGDVLNNKNFLWLEPLFFNRYIKLVWFEFLVLAASMLILFSYHLLRHRGKGISYINGKKVIVRWSIYTCLVYFIVLFGIYHNKNEFIYFQF